MTVNEAIMAADELRPNAYTEEQKVAWLSRLDGKIVLEVHHSKNLPKYEYPNDRDTELLVQEPHCNIYPLYIAAMVDFYNKDTDAYVNSFEMFNSEYDIFAKWYIRNNMPPDSGGFKNYF